MDGYGKFKHSLSLNATEGVVTESCAAFTTTNRAGDMIGENIIQLQPFPSLTSLQHAAVHL